MFFDFIAGNNSSCHSSMLHLKCDLRETSGGCFGSGGNAGSSEVYV